MTTSKMTPYRRFDVERVTLYALLTISVAANVFFGLRYGSAPPPRVQARVPLPAVGTRMPPLNVESVRGEPSVVRFDGGKRGTLIYLFAPKCSWCARNLSNIRALAARLQPEYAIVGVSVSADGLDEYLAKNALPFPVYRKPSPATAKAFAMSSTPTTYLLRPDGALEKAWTGAYLGKTGTDVEQLFGLKLPGVAN